ncbi:MAG: hypothetical protein ACK5LN_12850 [Propioniciclava sp.]
MSQVGGPEGDPVHPPRVRARGGLKADGGMVTVEMAAASLLLGVLLAGLLAVVVGAFRVAECQVVANEVARQQARGDAAAVARTRDDRPEGTTVSVAAEDGVAMVRVQCDSVIGGVRFPVEVSARVVSEDGG